VIILKAQYLVIPVTDEERQRFDHVCSKLGITIEQFFNTALREGELEILSTEAFSPGGSFCNEEQSSQKDSE